MKRLFPLLLVAASLLAVSSPAYAYKGCFGGVRLGAAVVDTKATIGTLPDGGADTAGTLGAMLGCNARISPHVFVGLELGGDVYGMHRGSPAIAGTSGAQLGKSAEALAKLGYMLNDQVALYAVGGYGWSWANDITAGSLTVTVPRYAGPIAGFGFETRLGNGWHLDARYEAQFDRAESIAGGAASLEAIEHRVRLGAVLYLNGDGETKAAKPPRP